MSKAGKTIWVVTSGEFSDYGIDAIFSTFEAAEKYAAILNRYRDSHRVELFPLDPDHVLLRDPNLNFYVVRFDNAGEVREVRDEKLVPVSMETKEEPEFRSFDDGAIVYLWAKTPNLAKKIALNEYRSRARK